MGRVVVFLFGDPEGDFVQAEFLSAASPKYKVLPLSLFDVVPGETRLIVC